VTALLERINALPAAQPLLPRLPAQPPVHLVGGAVRDLLLGGRPYDLDLVVEGDAAAVAAVLNREARVHDRFGTSTVVLNGYTYDFATARRETYPRPGALPEVTVPAPLNEDLTRRDFTVNAIAVALNGPAKGELQHVPQALEDLEAKRLRVLHERSFIDDPTRMLRLARYAGRLKFEIEPQTRTLVDPHALHTVSGPRIGTELRLLAREPDPLSALLILRDLGLDRAIDPEFGLAEPDLARRALALLPKAGRPDRVILALAARGIPAERLTELLDRLGFEAVDRTAIAAAATQADDLATRLAAAQRPAEIADAVAGAPEELIVVAGALGPDDQAEQWLQHLRHVALDIDGADLLAAGVPQGPSVGRGLRAALSAKLDGRAPDRAGQMQEALRVASGR
jgi:tRNA nucleotidyltransferase (CCA-adding enzyme)